uniref:Uncharacterized protein n=1 Tax=Ectopseudomonas oleovorans TaxID=301 RepID=A0A653B8N9_ECTOL
MHRRSALYVTFELKNPSCLAVVINSDLKGQPDRSCGEAAA